MMKPDIDTLFKDALESPVPTPSTTHILNVSSVDEVNTLVNSVTVTYWTRNFIPIPPFLLETIQNLIQKSNGDSKSMLVDCVSMIKFFDTEHTKDVNYTKKASSKCKDIMF